jgi:hypothetical protein
MSEARTVAEAIRNLREHRHEVPPKNFWNNQEWMHARGEFTEIERLDRRIVKARQIMKMPPSAIQKVSREGLGLYQMGDKIMGPYQVLRCLGR